MTLQQLEIPWVKICAILLPVLALAAIPVSAFAWAITKVSPNPVKAGCKVTLMGSFGTQAGKSVRYGTGAGGTAMPVKSWSSTAIKVDTSAMAPNGRYWIGIYGWNGARLAKTPKTLYVAAEPCSSSSGGASIRPRVGTRSGIKPPKKVKSNVAVKAGIQPPKQVKSTVAVRSGIKPPKNKKVKSAVATERAATPVIHSRLGIGSGIKPPKMVKPATAAELALIPMIREVRASDDGNLIKPGQQVRIRGMGFGRVQGKVYFRVPYFQNSTRELENVGWVSGFEILGRIPALPRGVRVHAKAEYQVESSKGRKSAWFTPSFRLDTKTAARFGATQPLISRVTGPAGIGRGKDFVIEGVGFGDRPGGVVMRSDWPAYRNTNYSVQNVVWESSQRIRATIPKELNATKEVRFQVTKHGGKSSPWYITPFDNTVEVLLSWGSPNVTKLKCGSSDIDQCLGEDTPGIPWRLNINEVTVRGYHSQNWGHRGNDKDYDQYSIRLSNGWVISRVQRKFSRSSGDESISESPADAANAFVGKSEVILRVGWSVSPADYVMYEYKIWIKGPRGTRNLCGPDTSNCEP